MKILLKGYYGFGNFGDDVLLKVIHACVTEKYAHADVYVFSNFTGNLQSFNRYPGYNHYIFKVLNEPVKLIDWTDTENFDLVVDGGGGVYFDTSRGPRLRTLMNKFFMLIGSKRVARLDSFLRKITGKNKRLTYSKRISVGIGIGPYTKSSTLFFQHLAEIGSTNAILVRDKTSLTWLKDFGFKGYQSICADLAFLSQFWQNKSFQSSQRGFKGDVGIILLDLPQYKEKLFTIFKKFADQLIEQGNRVTFFSFDSNHDKNYSSAFKDSYDFVAWQPDQMTTDDVLNKLSGMDVVFSGRAHGVIISALLGVPTVCLGTSKKLIEVSKMFPSLPVVHEPITQEELLQKFSYVKENYPDTLKLLEKDVQSNKVLAADTLSKLQAHL